MQANGIITLNMYVYLNGKIVPAKEAMVSVFDHGFLYGDGIYETMRVYDVVIFMLDEHIRRLYRSASLIGLTIPTPVDSLKISLYEILIANSLKSAYMRLTVSRGEGPIGLDPELCPEPTVVIIAQELKDYPRSYYEKGISLIIPETRRNLKEAINPRIKSLNFLNNILAKIKAKEGEFTKDDIYSAEEVFITNSTLEVMPVSKVDDQMYAVGKIAKLLRGAYSHEVNAYVANVRAEGPSLWGHNG